MRPLQAKVEPVYVVPESDAEAYVEKRFPHKTIRRVGSGLRPQSIEGFLSGLPLVFQRGVAKDVDATFHFMFTGAERCEATVVTRDCGTGWAVRRPCDGGQFDVAEVSCERSGSCLGPPDA